MNINLRVWQKSNIPKPNYCADIAADGQIKWGAWGYSEHDATEKAIDAMYRGLKTLLIPRGLRRDDGR
jgi:hypothetical protein